VRVAGAGARTAKVLAMKSFLSGKLLRCDGLFVAIAAMAAKVRLTQPKVNMDDL
jgi:hypothetical protein